MGGGGYKNAILLVKYFFHDRYVKLIYEIHYKAKKIFEKNRYEKKRSRQWPSAFHFSFHRVLKIYITPGNSSALVRKGIITKLFSSLEKYPLNPSICQFISGV